MRNISAIIEREIRAYFTSPIAYAVLAFFAVLSWVFFQIIFSNVMNYAMTRSMQGAQFGQPPQPLDVPGMISQGFLSSMPVLLLFLIPMITMALFSEEKRRGTIELLLTAPITDMQVVIGKFLAAAFFFALLLVVTGVPMFWLFVYGDPASGPILTAYLGLLLYGLALVALGMFISSLTENQIIAAVLSFGLAITLFLIDAMASRAESTTRALLTYLSILSHLDDFLKGVLSTTHVIFYLSLVLTGLFLTYRSLDSLRWRA